MYLSGTIGHVAHGKSTVVKAISGVQVSIPFRVEKGRYQYTFCAPLFYFFFTEKAMLIHIQFIRIVFFLLAVLFIYLFSLLWHAVFIHVDL